MRVPSWSGHLDLFRQLLDSDKKALRAAACRYLGRRGDQASFDKIARLTQDPRPLVRRYAGEALGALGRPEAVGYLVRLSRDPSMDVRDMVPGALEGIPGGAATMELFGLFRERGEGMSWSVQESALDALVARRDKTAIPLLIQMIDPPPGFSPTPSLPGALKRLAGHWIEGDYDAPADRKRLAGEWRKWWQETGRRAPAPAKPQPEEVYCGCRLTIHSPRKDENTGEVAVGYSLTNEGGVSPLVVPVKDEGVDGYFQYVLFQDDREVERGDIRQGPFLLSRYHRIPYGSIGSIGGMRASGFRFAPRAPPGSYKMQIEARYLCTERVGLDFVNRVFAEGARMTTAEAFTLKSNRCPLVLNPLKQGRILTDDAVEQLARILADPKAGKQTITLTGKIGAEGSESNRGEFVKSWLKHCFSSPEEHFMARARLAPLLNDILGEERRNFYRKLVPTLHDPWMVHDAMRFSAAGSERRPAQPVSSAAERVVGDKTGVPEREPDGTWPYWLLVGTGLAGAVVAFAVIVRLLARRQAA